MSGLRSALLSLQHGDSFFPSGSIAFSYGLETLHHDGLVTSEDQVRGFVVEQLRGRWSTLDRGVLAAAWGAHLDMDRLRAIDALQHAMTLPRELRVGSLTAGQALLTVHRALETPGIAAMSACVERGDTHGHQAVVQGVAWAGCGLGLVECGLLSAHTLVVGMLGAALRLGIIGHLGAQRILAATHPEIADTLQHPAPALDRLHAYTPLADIAVMRHESQGTRLFSN